MFDWVEKRAKCNVRELFSHLREVVKSDVDSAREHVSADGFEFRDGPATTSFMVAGYAVKTGGATARIAQDVRRFHLSGSTIEVFNKESRPVIEARAALVGGADCLVDVVGREPMRLWEFSRLALEDLFFVGR